jgi:hypothetical protein
MDNQILIIGIVLYALYYYKENINKNLIILVIILIALFNCNYKETFIIGSYKLCNSLGASLKQMIKSEEKLCSPINGNNRDVLNSKINCRDQVDRVIAADVDYDAWCNSQEQPRRIKCETNSLDNKNSITSSNNNRYFEPKKNSLAVKFINQKDLNNDKSYDLDTEELKLIENATKNIENLHIESYNNNNSEYAKF